MQGTDAVVDSRDEERAESRTSGAQSVNAGTRVNYGVLPECIGFNLRISYALATQLFVREVEGRDLAPIQFAALELILHNPNLSQREIAHHIGSTPSVLVKPLEKLENRALISRIRSADDRRRSRIQITPEGEALLAEARQRIQTVEEKLTANLSDSERRTLLDLLHKMMGRS